MIEVIVWCIFPLMLSFGLLFLSARCLWDNRSIVQAVSTVVVCSLLFFADSTLVLIMAGAWPSFIPHALIALSVPVVLWQVSRVFAAA